MNKLNAKPKLTFLAVASTLVILQTSDEGMNSVHADGQYTQLPDSLISETLSFDEKSLYTFESMTMEEMNIEINAYRDYQKKLEEEERLRLESLKTYIYINTNNLTILSNIKVQELSMLLQNTNLQSLAQDYLDAQEIYGVNAIFLAALTANESGWGNSELAITKNNLTGYAAYPGQEHNAKYFNSKRECIMETARLLSNHYLNPEGKYFNGYSIESVNIMYCQFADGTANYKWTNAIKDIMTRFATELKPITEDLKEDVDAVSYVYFNDVEQQ